MYVNLNMFLAVFIVLFPNCQGTAEDFCNSLTDTVLKKTIFANTICLHTTNVAKSWTEAFKFCDSFNTEDQNFTRMVQVNSSKIWTRLKEYPFTNLEFWLGAKTDIEDSENIDEWYWRQDGNPNSWTRLTSVQVDFAARVLLGDDGQDYLRRYVNDYQDAENDRANVRAMCETYENHCEPSTCLPGKVCVAEPGTYRCVCPSGQVPVGDDCLDAAPTAINQSPYYPVRNVTCNEMQCSGNESCSSFGYGCICSLSLDVGDCIGYCEHGYKIHSQIGCRKKEFNYCEIEKNCTGPTYKNDYVEDTVNEWDDNCGSNGLFLGPECFKVIKLSSGVKWSEAFAECTANNNMRLAHIYNTNQNTLDTITGYLLKNYPNKRVWTGLKFNGTSADYHWMKSPTEAMVEYTGEAFDPAYNQGDCIALKAKTWGWNRMEDHPMATIRFNCGTEMLNNVLCMKDTNYAKYNGYSGKKMTGTGAVLFSERTDSLEYCGKRCRSRPYCLGINFAPLDQIGATEDNCEVLRVNTASLQQPTGGSGAGGLEFSSDQHFSFYERIF